jgi:glycosyltransferase involved in cell wall biosynthesis/GT2 family glycosyltransferase
MKHCIVTPDLSGPDKNGGIGTYVYHLAAYLSKELGEGVEILLTSVSDKAGMLHWKQYFKSKFDLTLTYASELPETFRGRVDCGGHLHNLSTKIDLYLRHGNYQFIHFQDWLGLGFVATQAKKAGLAYAHTTLTLTMHSNTEWFGEGGRHFFSEGMDNLLTEYSERYCVEHADLLLSPSRYMFNWAEEHHWTLAKNREVVPNLSRTGELPAHWQNHYEWKTEALIFFGRLETRKGLDLFLKTLSLIHKSGDLKKVKHIVFLGRVWQLNGLPADEAIANFFAEELPGQQFELITNFDHQQAVEYLDNERQRSLVVLPSLCDNYPYTVLECLDMSLHFIASRVGGIPEMVEDSVLFDLQPASMAKSILGAFRANEALPVSLYSLENAKSRIRDVLEQNVPKSAEQAFASEGARANANPTFTDTTVCVTFYNYGNVLPDLLRSLHGQTDKDFTVVVVNDGSTDPDSIRVFDELQIKYASLGWRFVHKANGGIGQTRNFAASLAEGLYIIFMDADNVAHPRMVEVYRNAIRRDRADCFTCYMLAFSEKKHPDQGQFDYCYTPYGPCLEAGVYFNVFGDANCIIKREAFLQVGGFNEDRHTSFEDYEFFAKLIVAGLKMDVVPEFLFYYRVTPGGFSRATNGYENQMRGIRPILQSSQPWQARFIKNAFGLNAAHHGLLDHHRRCPLGPGGKKRKSGLSRFLRDCEESFRRNLLKPAKRKLFGNRPKQASDSTKNDESENKNIPRDCANQGLSP